MSRPWTHIWLTKHYYWRVSSFSWALSFSIAASFLRASWFLFVTKTWVQRSLEIIRTCFSETDVTGHSGVDGDQWQWCWSLSVFSGCGSWSCSSSSPHSPHCSVSSHQLVQCQCHCCRRYKLQVVTMSI